MKKAVSILSVLCMALTLFAGCGQQNTEPPAETAAPTATAAPAQTEAPEPAAEPAALAYASGEEDYVRAFDLGLVDESYAARELDEQVTSTEYKAMLTRMIEDLAPEELAYFNAKVTDYDTPMTRGEAVVMSWYSAVCIGADGYNFGPFNGENPRMRGDDFWQVDGAELEKLLPDCWKDIPVASTVDTWSNDFTASFIWNAWHCSPYSGKQVVAYDEAAGSMRNNDALTVEAAACAVARLYDSATFDLAVYLAGRTPAEAELPILAAADARREAIVGGTAAWTPADGGTAYYVSPDGDDGNDGRSPETAWATVERALKYAWFDLRPGDAVLLERGGTWQLSYGNDWIIGVPEGVTVSAYGEGAKPILRGDTPKANAPAFWTLYHEENGVRIWQSAEKLHDTNVIVFDEGNAYAYEVTPWLSRQGYCNFDGSPFEVETALVDDLSFCCLLDGITPETKEEAIQKLTGTVYLRCDAGNPAEVYGSVAVPQRPNALSPSSHTRLDSLDFRYFYTTSNAMACYDGSSDKAMTNCDVGWCGGTLKEYHRFRDTERYSPFTSGGAIQASGPEVTVSGCWIHDCGPMSIVCAIEGTMDHHYHDTTFSDNLFERCGVLQFTDFTMMFDPGKSGDFENLVIENNMFLYSGMGWVEKLVNQPNDNDAYFLSALENVAGGAINNGIYIRNNVFYLSTHALFSLTDYLFYYMDWQNRTPVNADPAFSGNTYAQFFGLPVLDKDYEQHTWYPTDDILAVLGDSAGTVILLR